VKAQFFDKYLDEYTQVPLVKAQFFNKYSQEYTQVHLVKAGSLTNTQAGIQKFLNYIRIPHSSSGSLNLKVGKGSMHLQGKGQSQIAILTHCHSFSHVTCCPSHGPLFWS